MVKDTTCVHCAQTCAQTINTRPYKTSGIDYHWQSDLIEILPHASVNKNYKYIMTVIDIFSKYAWALPIKNKTGEDVTEAFSQIFAQDKRIPSLLQTDDGREYENKTFQTFLKKHNVKFFTLTSAYKASVAERFNRILKTFVEILYVCWKL